MPFSLEHRNREARVDYRTFIVPARQVRSRVARTRPLVCAVIPTYAPSPLALALVKDLLRWNPRLRVYVVDDSTPLEYKDSAEVLKSIAALPERVTLLRTPVNKLKAGALNHALRHMENTRGEIPYDVIITLDDDVHIDSFTIKTLVAELLTYENLGAVCSQCYVLNKNKNLLTRLQGLEYVGFNAIRLSDQGFLRGPLVMHGMLTAFRTEALREVGGFCEGHLIEDYEITAQIKTRGWSVKSVVNARAGTVVPETLSKLWRQRTRWCYGGVTVVARTARLSSVFQDVLGHGVFFTTVSMVALLFLFRGSGEVPATVAEIIIVLSFFQLGVWYLFQLWLMRFHHERDVYDWIVRILLFPEFIYGYIMTASLLGSYFFFLFGHAARIALARRIPFSQKLYRAGSSLFRACGYTEAWGTRARKT